MNMKSAVLKTISENTHQTSGKIYGMWIIGYYDGAKPLSVKLVCGEKKVKGEGDVWYVGKGMSVKDFQAFKPHFPEFALLSATPPPFPEAPAPDVAATETTEEAPW